MDEIVRLSLARWPNVPDCTGWLALDGRGRWRIGSERQTITHAPMIAFISRNYVCDDAGRWFFQNGPQRVFVELDFTPFVWRLVPAGDGQLALLDHTGASAQHTTGVWLADNGRFLIQADHHIGVLHDHDSSLLLDLLTDAAGRALAEEDSAERLNAWLEQPAGAHASELWVSLPGSQAPLPLQQIAADDVAHAFGFEPRPQLEGGTPGNLH